MIFYTYRTLSRYSTSLLTTIAVLNLARGDRTLFDDIDPGPSIVSLLNAETLA